MRQLSGFDARQVMNRTDFEIAHKRDTMLTEVELHHHDFYEVNYLVSGYVTYAIEDRVYRAQPGDLVFIGPRELHQLTIHSDKAPYERFVLWIAPSFVRELSSAETDLSRMFDTRRPDYSNFLRPSPEMRDTVLRLITEIEAAEEENAYGRDLLHRLLPTRFLILLNRLAEENAPVPQENDPSGQMIASVVEYINLHYGDALPLEELADRFYVSKYHLCHEFRRRVGSGLHQFIRKKRLQNARRLLARGEKPAQVYVRCGFGDYTAFYRAFRSEYGISPRQYLQMPEDLI